MGIFKFGHFGAERRSAGAGGRDRGSLMVPGFSAAIRAERDTDLLFEYGTRIRYCAYLDQVRSRSGKI